ncbi:MAG: hypothetical protein KC940_14745, partial [Candidatus Omnitrophica bacterium]|nr:hypothetical protein [Candidatus Omnitrophota bacterium]
MDRRPSPFLSAARGSRGVLLVSTVLLAIGPAVWAAGAPPIFFTHRADPNLGNGIGYVDSTPTRQNFLRTDQEPVGLSFDSMGNLFYTLDLDGSYQLMKRTFDGQIINLGVIHSQISGRIGWSFDIAVGPRGDIYFTHRLDTRLGSGIGKVDSEGKIVPVVENISDPVGLAFDSQGNLFFTKEVDYRYRLMRLSPGGTLNDLGVIHVQEYGRAGWSFDLAVNDHDEIFFTHRRDTRFGSGISKVDADGNIVTVLEGIDEPQGLAFDSEGNLYFSEEKNQSFRLKQFTPDGVLTDLGLLESQAGGRAAWSFDLATTDAEIVFPIPTPTATHAPTQTPTPTPTREGPCDSGYYVLDVYGGRHRVGNPYRITGSLYFGTDFARDLERAKVSNGDATAEDLVVLDAAGTGHFVQFPEAAIDQMFYFGDSMQEFPQGRATDLVMTADSRGLWVLTDYGGVFRAGSALNGGPVQVPNTGVFGMGLDVPIGPETRASGLKATDGATLRAVSLVVIDEDRDNLADGYIILDSMGGRIQIDDRGVEIPPGYASGADANSPQRLLDPGAYVWPYFQGLDIARDLELHPSQQGAIVLDGWGGIHPVPVDDPANPVHFAAQDGFGEVPSVA